MEKLHPRNVISVVNKRNNSNHMLAGTLNTPSKKERKKSAKRRLVERQNAVTVRKFYRDSFSQVENAGIWTVQQVCCLHLNYKSAIFFSFFFLKEKKKRD